MSYIKVNVEQMRSFAVAMFMYHGLSSEDSNTVADVLLTADLFGIESHGVQRLIRYHKALTAGQVVTQPNIEVCRETDVSATLDAHQCLGHIAGNYAMRMAIEKAKRHGVGMVAVRESSHFGIAGYYTAMTLPERMLGFATTNTEQIGIPTFGVRPMFGTNPLAFSMPASPFPFWFDAATTVVPLGKMEIYEKAGKRLPDEWAIDASGRVQTDPHQVRADIRSRNLGGILPLGGVGTEHSGHKGYGFALIAEICSSILAGGLTCTHMADGSGEEHTSHFFAAIDYGMFGDKQAMEDSLSAYLQEIRESEKAEGCDRIYTHGEQAWISREDKLANGIPLQEATIAELKGIARQIHVPFDI